MLEHLKFLDLHENNLDGEIPPEIGNAIALERLYLHNNNLEGAVPTSLKNLVHLKYLYMQNNALQITHKMSTDAAGDLSFRTEGDTMRFIAYLRAGESACCVLA